MIRKIIGALLLVFGLILKITLTHNIDYWGFSKNISIISFIIGLILLTPFRLIDSSDKDSKKTKSSKLILSKGLNLIIIAILFVCGLGLEKFGNYLNYKTRVYFLSQNTESTIGIISGIKRINIVKVGEADFYEISFKVNRENYSNGLLLDYAEKDSEYFDKFRKPEITKNTMAIGKLKGSQVNIIYSKRFPSFFRIGE
jgi:hypothetical protein